MLVIVGAFATLMARSQRRGARRSHLSFVQHLGAKLHLDVSTDPAKLEGTTLTGQLDDGRKVAVAFVTENKKPQAQFSVEVRSAPRLRVKIRDFWSGGGLQTGDARFDGWFHIETSDPRKTHTAIKKGEGIRKAI